jgi:hypothetical protein
MVDDLFVMDRIVLDFLLPAGMSEESVLVCRKDRRFGYTWKYIDFMSSHLLEYLR